MRHEPPTAQSAEPTRLRCPPRTCGGWPRNPEFIAAVTVDIRELRTPSRYIIEVVDVGAPGRLINVVTGPIKEALGGDNGKFERETPKVRKYWKDSLGDAEQIATAYRKFGVFVSDGSKAQTSRGASDGGGHFPPPLTPWRRGAATEARAAKRPAQRKAAEKRAR
ncbi:hypothetical protein T492DRAFT_832316 [Pavlovales sp. CCMP2436]|nr:hypothetical protein T492DRAFT_832316 [Pavlovales sp. CCMP2436]